VRPGTPEPTSPEQTKRQAPKSLTTAQVDTALEFSQEHHAELATLLNQLRDSSPAGFKRGIRELHRTVQRLERFRDAQPIRFATELKEWKADSRIRLLAAKWISSQDPDLETRIQELLRERQQTRLERLTKERDRIAERLKQLDMQLVRESGEEALTEEWERLQKRAAIHRGKRRSKKPTAAETPASKDSENAD
jgi:hypothetical protein